MSYSYTIQSDLNLVVIQLQGDVNYLQEVEAVTVVFMDKRIRQDVRILIDRTQAPIKTNPDKVSQLLK